MDISDIRRENLRALMNFRFNGKQVLIAEALEKPSNYISRCLSVSMKPGNRKKIGEDFARQIEQKLGLDRYQLDRPGAFLPGASSSNPKEPQNACSPTALTPEPSNVTLSAQPTRFYRYPVLSEVQAGAWTEAIQPYEPGAEDSFELTDYQARGPAFWLRVSGDSMTSPTSPSIPEGHLILVDTGLVPQPGDLVVAKLDSEEKATFKKLVSDAGQLYLKPLNPAYRMIPIDGNCRLIGVVKEAKVKL